MADIAKPLFAISKVSAKDFKWETEHEKAFNHVKLLVTSSLCLAHYDDTAPIELFTDSSEFAISAMLAIVRNDKRHPVAFWSHCINTAEINYSIYDKEFLALYSAVKQFRPFLLHRKFTVYLDNAGVAYLHSLKLSQSSPRTARYVTYLSEFMFEVRKVPSRLNPADTLSRVRCNDRDCATCRQPRRFLSVPFFFHDSTPIQVLPTENKSTQTGRRQTIPEISTIESINMGDEQKVDADINYLRNRLTDGSLLKLPATELSSLSPRLRKLLIWAPDMEVKNDILVVKNMSDGLISYKVVIPQHLYDQIIDSTHATTLKHVGAAKTIAYLKGQAIMPGIDKMVRFRIAQCRECATQKAYTKNLKAPMRSMPLEQPGHSIAVDHVGPLPPSNGYKYILTITDITSKHLALFPQREVAASETLSKLLQYFKTFGTCKRLLSDNGTAFKNRPFDELTQSMNIVHLFSTAYHPISNGQCERVNGVLKDMLTIATNYESGTWSSHLAEIQMVYNATVHQSTGFTPNFLHFGRELLLPNSIFESVSPEIQQHGDKESHILQTALWLRSALATARRNNKQCLKLSKTYFDRNSAAINSYCMGQRVFLKNMNAQKLELRYPKEFIITKKLHEFEYEIRNMSDPQDVRKVNVCHIKPFLAPLLPTSSDASTQMESSFDSPNVASDTANNLISKNVDVQTALNNQSEEEDDSPGIILHKRDLAYPPNYVPPRTRALTKRVGMDKRVPEPVVSPLQGEPHNEASLGQNDPDGVNGDINRQNWECDENSPPTDNEREAQTENSATVADNTNSAPEQSTPGDKGSSAKGASSDPPVATDTQDMRDPSAQTPLNCSSTTISNSVNQGTKVRTHKSLVSAQKASDRMCSPTGTSAEPTKTKYHYFLRSRSSKSNAPHTFLVVDNSKPLFKGKKKSK